MQQQLINLTTEYYSVKKGGVNRLPFLLEME